MTTPAEPWQAACAAFWAAVEAGPDRGADPAAALAWAKSQGAVKAWKAAALAARQPQPTPGGSLRSDAETAAMLRADLEDAEAQLARWPKCPSGCSCRLGFEGDADRNECGCDGPCNGGEQPAPGNAPELRITDCSVHRDALHIQVNTGHNWLCAVALSAILAEYEPQPADDVKPAPGLAAAMADPDDGYLTPIDVLEQERDQLQEQLGRLQDSIGNLAAGLKLSADASRPSKKSEIEDGAAAALLGILDPRPPVEQVTVNRHLL
jgi:hypothetical protein